MAVEQATRAECAGSDAWDMLEAVCAALGRGPGPPLSGYDFVGACEPIAAAEPALLVASPDPAHFGRPMLALCDGGRQLAIAKWSLPSVHRAARECRAWRARAKHGTAPAGAAGAPSRAEPGAGASDAPRELELASRALVLLNGHCSSGWHARKRLLLDGGDGDVGGFGALSVTSELAFSALVLRRFPGAPDAWAHRRWLLSRAAGERSAQAAHGGGFACEWAAELRLCGEAAAAKRANYYSGQQRGWLLARLPPSGPAARLPAALSAELRASAALLAAHPSDSSAQHSRQAAVLAAIASAGAAALAAGAAAELAEVAAWQRRLAAAELQVARGLLRTFAGSAGAADHRAAELAGRPQPHAVLLAHHRFAAALCAQLGSVKGAEDAVGSAASSTPAPGGEGGEGAQPYVGGDADEAGDEAAFARAHWHGDRPLRHACGLLPLRGVVPTPR